MAIGKNISQELNELGSSLLNTGNQPVYTVPAGYFENLAEQVLGRIKALEADSATEELAHLSPLLSGIGKTMPYHVPAGYFEEIEERMLYAMMPADQPAGEELETLSPLLARLNKQMPFEVPQGYFDNVTVPVNEEKQPPAKVIAITSRKWFKIAAAAMIVGVIATAALFLFRKPVTSEAKIIANVKKEYKKMDESGKEKVADFIDAGLIGDEYADLSQTKEQEIKELVKDISEEELKAFQQTSEDMEDILLTASE
jgi:gas vesicle protein